jgi:hypothetical protein
MKFEVKTDDKVTRKTSSSIIEKNSLNEAVDFIFSKIKSKDFHTTMWHNKDFTYAELVFYDDKINISKYIKITSENNRKQQGGK